MKNIALNIIKVVLPLAFGLFLVWYVYDLLDEREKQDLFLSLKQANYWWILLSVSFGILSHLSRAYRWKYLLDPLGLKPNFLNSFFSVMVGYTINLLLPRVGEVSRCGVLSKYEEMPFTKLFCTVIAERIADVTILATITFLVIFSQFDLLGDMLKGWMANDNEESSLGLYTLIVLAIGFLAFIGFLYLIKTSSNKHLLKIKSMLLGFWEGAKSIVYMKSSLMFILHTLFIWIMYVSMFYMCFFSLEATSNVPLMGMLAAFVMGGISIIFVQGGIGVYPAAVMQILFIYGVSKSSGLALGWIIWTSQTAMILILGVLSMLILPKYNKYLREQKDKGHE